MNAELLTGFGVALFFLSLHAFAEWQNPMSLARLGDLVYRISFFLRKVPELEMALVLLCSFFGSIQLAPFGGANSPVAFFNLGRFGAFLLRAMHAIVLFGGLSLIIWALIYAAWWALPAAMVIAWILVQVTEKLFWVRAVVCSALGPALFAIGIVVLHRFTWFHS